MHAYLRTCRLETGCGIRIWVVVLIALFSGSGCASFNAFDSTERIFDSEVPVNIVRGAPNRVIDSAGRLLGIPNRLAILDRRIDNHDISAATESELSHYMLENGLNETLVRVNQYHPLVQSVH